MRSTTPLTGARTVHSRRPSCALRSSRLLGGHRVLRPPHADRRIVQLQQIQLALFARGGSVGGLGLLLGGAGGLVAGGLRFAPVQPPDLVGLGVGGGRLGLRTATACFSASICAWCCGPSFFACSSSNCASLQVRLGRIDVVRRDPVVHCEQRRALLKRIAVVRGHLGHAAGPQRVERRDALFQVGIAEEVVVQVRVGRRRCRRGGGGRGRRVGAGVSAQTVRPAVEASRTPTSPALGGGAAATAASRCGEGSSRGLLSERWGSGGREFAVAAVRVVVRPPSRPRFRAGSRLPDCIRDPHRG